MAGLLIRLPAEDAAAIYVAVDAAARHLPQDSSGSGDRRSLDQLRADVLAGLGWSALMSGHLGCCRDDCNHLGLRLGTRRGRPVAVNVTVAYSTLIGVDDQPAHLEGYGPITAAVARRIAADGTWRRILTDPATGAVLDIGRQRYTPPSDLADHVIARARRPAGSPPAPGRPRAATSIVRRRSTRAARPVPPTSGRCTAATTTTKPTTAGTCTSPNPAATSGPHPPDTPTRSTPTPADPDPPPF
jgi:Domain of unknown function (DUF222)